MSLLPPSGVISFARGIPAPEMLPVEQLAECSARALARHGLTALNYGPAEGFAPLRAWIAARHGVSPGRVVVTPGSLVAMNLVAGHLLREQPRAIVEAPTYDRMLAILRLAGADVMTVARTETGLDLGRLGELLGAGYDPAFVYLLPTFHNPTGRSIGREQREQLAELAVAHRLVVIEDDPYGLLRLGGEPAPSMLELLRERGADALGVHLSSFSKVVAPGLRVGYAVLPEPLVEAVAALATSLYLSPPLLAQAELYEFLDAGLLEPHLERLRGLLRPRRDTLLQVLGERLPKGARLTRPDGGYFAWLDLPEPLDASTLAARAQAAGVSFVPGAGFFSDPAAGARSARLSFSYPPVQDIRVGAERLAALVADCLTVAEQR